MSGPNSDELGLLSKLVIAAAILLFAAGLLWHGVTVENLQRLWGNLVDRPSRAMSFRFILQPTMSAIAAIGAGIRDARTGRSPYLWAMLRAPQGSARRLREGLNATARIILLGLVMDVIYQLLVLKMFYPVEALIISLLLAFVPYVLIRGPTERIARRWLVRRAADEIR
jgi:hypothetical protein